MLKGAKIADIFHQHYMKQHLQRSSTPANPTEPKSEPTAPPVNIRRLQPTPTPNIDGKQPTPTPNIDGKQSTPTPNIGGRYCKARKTDKIWSGHVFYANSAISDQFYCIF